MDDGRDSESTSHPSEDYAMSAEQGASWPLEQELATMLDWARRAAGVVCEEIDGAPFASASGVTGRRGWAEADALSLPIGEEPLAGGLDRALTTITEASRLALNTISPGYLAYVPGGGLYTSALASFLAAGFNRFTGLAAAAPGFARLEADTLRWLAGEVGLGDGAGGLFTSGGSLANFSAVVTARHALLGDDGDYREALVYATGQAHRSVTKAARLAGIPAANVREVATDGALRLDPAALDAALDADAAGGARPFLVVASAGTTNTGAVDPLDAIADVCERRGVWLHIDAAYGGFFALCDEGRPRLGALARGDSITLDPHKGMFLPYGLGCLLVKDGARLRAAHTEAADYLADLAGDDPLAVPSPADLGPELSRNHRGLLLWLPLMVHGARAFRDGVAEKLTLAARLRRGLAGLPVEVPLEPELSVVVFRAPRRREESLTAWNARNRELLARINGRERVHLSSTTLPVHDGAALTVRACVLSYRTHAEHIDACLDDIAAALNGIQEGVRRR